MKTQVKREEGCSVPVESGKARGVQKEEEVVPAILQRERGARTTGTNKAGEMLEINEHSRLS